MGAISQEAALLVAKDAEKFLVNVTLSSVLVHNGIFQPKNGWLLSIAAVGVAAAERCGHLLRVKFGVKHYTFSKLYIVRLSGVACP